VWQRWRDWWATASSSVVFHRRAKWFWTLLIPFSYVMRESVAWVTFMSHYAIITGHWSSEEAAFSAVMKDGREVEDVLLDMEAKLNAIAAAVGAESASTDT
jgi:hypothetical protein